MEWEANLVCEEQMKNHDKGGDQFDSLHREVRILTTFNIIHKFIN